MSSLRELVGNRLALQHQLESMDFDEVTIADTLEGDSPAILAKVEDYCYVLRNMDSMVLAVIDEKKRMAEREKLMQARIDRIKEWLLINMQVAGISKLESPIFTISLQNNPASVVIDDESLIPADYFVQPDPPAPSLSKALIKQAIADGYTVAGAHIEQKQRLVIK